MPNSSVKCLCVLYYLEMIITIKLFNGVAEAYRMNSIFFQIIFYMDTEQTFLSSYLVNRENNTFDGHFELSNVFHFQKMVYTGIFATFTNNLGISHFNLPI